jgi:hypothetical protein
MPKTPLLPLIVPILTLVVAGVSFPQRLVLIGFSALALALAWINWDNLGGAWARCGTGRWKEFLEFSRSLEDGGVISLIYYRYFVRALDVIESSLGPRWSALGLDRILWVSITTPIVCLYLVYVSTGKVGIPEASLGLRTGDPIWWRIAGSAILVLEVGLFWLAGRNSGRKRLGALAIGICAGIAGFQFCAGISFLAPIALIAAIAGSGMVGIVFLLAFLCFLAVVGAVLGTKHFGLFVVFDLSAFILALGVSYCLNCVAQLAKRSERFGAFAWPCYVLVAGTCLVMTTMLSSFSDWRIFGPIFLFMSLFVLIKAFFDWLALEISREFVGHGHLRGGYFPVLFGLVNFLVSAVLLAVLACAFVGAVMVFDGLATIRGGSGARVLQLIPIFDALRSKPGDSANLWILLTFYSLLAPSFLSLLMVAPTLLKGVPWINAWNMNRVRELRGLRGRRAARRRAFLTVLLTVEQVGGVASTIFAMSIATRLLPSALASLGEVALDLASKLAIIAPSG